MAHEQLRLPLCKAFIQQDYLTICVCTKLHMEQWEKYLDESEHTSKVRRWKSNNKQIIVSWAHYDTKAFDGCCKCSIVGIYVMLDVGQLSCAWTQPMTQPKWNIQDCDLRAAKLTSASYGQRSIGQKHQGRGHPAASVSPSLQSTLSQRSVNATVNARQTV